MTNEGVLHFNNLNISYIRDESEGVIIHNEAYVLYNGSTYVATNPAVGRRPSVTGIFKGRTYIDSIINEVGNKDYLIINNETRGYGAILDFDYNYHGYGNGARWYTFKLSFGLQNTSTGQ